MVRRQPFFPQKTAKARRLHFLPSITRLVGDVAAGHHVQAAALRKPRVAAMPGIVGE